MTPDQELTVLAGRAIGLERDTSLGNGFDDGGRLVIEWDGYPIGSALVTWCPLDYTAEAFELMLTLGITVSEHEGKCVAVFVQGGLGEEVLETVQVPIKGGNDGRVEAARRAIVMAAAAIQKHREEDPPYPLGVVCRVLETPPLGACGLTLCLRAGDPFHEADLAAVTCTSANDIDPAALALVGPALSALKPGQWLAISVVPR